MDPPLHADSVVPRTLSDPKSRPPGRDLKRSPSVAYRSSKLTTNATCRRVRSLKRAHPEPASSWKKGRKKAKHNLARGGSTTSMWPSVLRYVVLLLSLCCPGTRTYALALMAPTSLGPAAPRTGSRSARVVNKASTSTGINVLPYAPIVISYL